MFYIFKDGSGYQQFPEPAPGSAPYFEVDGNTETRILNGDPWGLNGSANAVVFLDPLDVQAQQDADALTAEREGMIVSAFQAYEALAQAGLLDTAEAAIAGAGATANRAWNKAQNFERNSNLVAAIAGQLGLTDERVDDLFRQAKTIST